MKKLLASLLLFSSVAFAGSGTIVAPPSTGIAAGGTVTSGTVKFNDDLPVTYGTGSDVTCRWETADANANYYLCAAPEGGATNVPAMVWGDATLVDLDIGLFDGLTDPTFIIGSDDGTKFLKVSHDGTNAVLDTTSGNVSIPDGAITNFVTFSGNSNGPAAANRIFLDAANGGRLTTVVPGGGSMAWGFAGSASMIFDGSNLYLQNDNGWAIGKAGRGVADIFLADGAYLNFANGGGTINYDTNNGFFIFDREVHFGQGADFEGLDLDNVGEANITTLSTGSAYIGAPQSQNLVTNHLSYEVSNVTSANIPAGDCAVYSTVAANGAVEGDAVTATPLASTSANGIEDVDLTWNAYVDGNDFVSIKACNPHAVGDINTDNDQEWRIELWRN